MLTGHTWKFDSLNRLMLTEYAKDYGIDSSSYASKLKLKEAIYCKWYQIFTSDTSLRRQFEIENKCNIIVGSWVHVGYILIRGDRKYQFIRSKEDLLSNIDRYGIYPENDLLPVPILTKQDIDRLLDEFSRFDLEDEYIIPHLTDRLTKKTSYFRKKWENESKFMAWQTTYADKIETSQPHNLRLVRFKANLQECNEEFIVAINQFDLNYVKNKVEDVECLYTQVEKNTPTFNTIRGYDNFLSFSAFVHFKNIPKNVIMHNIGPFLVDCKILFRFRNQFQRKFDCDRGSPNMNWQKAFIEKRNIKNELKKMKQQRDRLSNQLLENDKLIAKFKILCRQSIAYLPLIDKSIQAPILTEVGGYLFQYIESWFTESVKGHRGRAAPRGNGTHVRPPPKLIVKKIVKISNPKLIDAYSMFRSMIISKHKLSISSNELEQVHNIASKSYILDTSNKSYNEAFLFHGVDTRNIDLITSEGLDPRCAGRRDSTGRPAYQPLFGQGAYLAENASKSDIYSRDMYGGDKCIFLVRTCLGKPYYARTQLTHIARPPDNTDSVIGVTNSEFVHDNLDGGGGSGSLDHREYIVYERFQSLPEFQIWYNHASDCACSVCVP